MTRTEPCSDCRTEVSVSAAICPRCGAPGKTLASCFACGNKIPVESVVCPECGYPASPIPARHEKMAEVIREMEERIRDLLRKVNAAIERHEGMDEYQLVLYKQCSSSAEVVLKLHAHILDLEEALQGHAS